MVTPRTVATVDVGAGAEALEPLSWSTKRELTGGALPGQVRAASGVATGSGTIEVRDPSTRTPWTSSKIAPGGKITIDAALDAPALVPQATSYPVARMVARSVGADGALTAKRDIEMADDLTSLRGPVSVPPFMYDTGNGLVQIDAAWVIDQAARAGGYFATPAPVSSAILSAPLCGSIRPEVGTVNPGSNPTPGWGTDPLGRVYTPSGSYEYTPTRPVNVGDVLYATWNYVGITDSGIELRISGTVYVYAYANSSGFVGISASDGSSATGSYATFAAFTDDPTRVQVKIERLSTTQTRISARGGPAESWGTPLTLTHASMGTFTYVRTRGCIGMQLTTVADAALWRRPTAVIGSSGSPLTALVAPTKSDAWSLMQQVAASTLGALWLDETGVLTYRGRDYVRGQTSEVFTGAPLPGAGGGAIVAETTLVDLPWSVGIDDVADRVELTYTPPDVVMAAAGQYTTTVWTSSDIVAVSPGKTYQTYIDLETAVDDLAPWYPVWDAGYAASRMSRWAASTQRDGGGTQPASNALTVTSDLVTPSRIRLRITNNTGGVLYTAGSDGTSQITIRATTLVSTGEPVTIATGKSAETAINPLAVDLGMWVQDDAAAAAALSWLKTATSNPLPVLEGVEMVPDLTCRLGDVRILRDPKFTNLVAKVLVVGVDLAATPGSLKQTLTLAVLDVVEGDIAALLLRAAVATEANLASYITTNLGAGATEDQLGTDLIGRVLA
ncbi:hypothetical protein [Cellulomonas sp. HZM]|uniref:hypothetical protein n=1 Tax=Cellulomonas sp. HZM TaxID=1454010 RepID=UPI0004936810|nr:hypothetical protein [Cellulomonas sp. HZM]